MAADSPARDAEEAAVGGSVAKWDGVGWGGMGWGLEKVINEREGGIKRWEGSDVLYVFYRQNH